MTEEIRLRDGSTVEDPRLDRLIEFDSRSFNFPISAVVPEDVRGRYWYLQSFFDQGYEGACVGFAFTHDLAASPMTVKNLSNDFARTNVYWEAQKIDPWDGGAYPGASPFYEGTSVLAGAKILQRMGAIEQYRWAFSIDEVMQAIAHQGPVIFGIPWWTGMFNTRPSGLLEVSGRVAGGHAILGQGLSLKPRLKGERISEPVVRLHNSWGKDWGVNGDAYIKVSDLERLLDDRGECCVPVGRQKFSIA